MSKQVLKLGDKVERNGKRWVVSKVGRKEARLDMLNDKGTNSICHHGFIIYQPYDSPLCASVNCHRRSCFVTMCVEVNSDGEMVT